jgi:hypothetical protein
VSIASSNCVIVFVVFSPKTADWALGHRSGTAPRDRDEHRGLRSRVVQGAQRQAHEPRDGAALEAAARAVQGLELDGALLDDDERVAPLLGVERARTAGQERDLAPPEGPGDAASSEGQLLSGAVAHYS